MPGLQTRTLHRLQHHRLCQNHFLAVQDSLCPALFRSKGESCEVDVEEGSEGKEHSDQEDDVSATAAEDIECEDETKEESTC